MPDPKSADQAEKEAVEERLENEPDEQLGHLSPLEREELEEKQRQGEIVMETLVEEVENRPDDHPVEVAKQERLDQEARVAGESERLQEAHGKDASTVEDDKYEGMTADELSGELESRGLPKTGSKSELLQRLKDNDET